MKSNLSKIAAFLALRQSIVALLTMVILVGMGERLGERYLPIYLIAMGGSYLSIGLLSVLDNFLSAVYSYFGGALTGRLGHKRSLFVFNLMALVGFMIVVLIPTWQAVIAGAFFFLSWTAISHPATMSLIGRALPADKRTMGITMHSLVRRIPMGIGPILGGLFLDTWGTQLGIRLAFSLAAVMTIVAIILQQKLIEDDQASQSSQPARKANPFALAGKFRGGLRDLLIADILVRFCEQIPYAFVVIWCMKEIENPITFTQFGLLTALEMATAMVIYIPIAVLADRLTKRPFILITFGFFTLFPLVLMFSHSFGWLVAAFVVRGLKEFGEPTRKALILDLAPEGNTAETFGLYYLIRDSFVAVAAFGGAFLWIINPAVNFLTAFGFGFAATVWFAVSRCGQKEKVYPKQ